MDKQLQTIFAVILGLIIGMTVGSQLDFMDSQLISGIVGALICSVLFPAIMKLKDMLAE